MATREHPAMQVSSQKSQVPYTDTDIYSLLTKATLLPRQSHKSKG